jgi:hypothetical protein
VPCPKNIDQDLTLSFPALAARGLPQPLEENGKTASANKRSQATFTKAMATSAGSASSPDTQGQEKTKDYIPILDILSAKLDRIIALLEVSRL